GLLACNAGYGLLLVLQRRTEDVAERGAAVGRAELRDRFLLVGQFHSLDRERDLAARAIEAGDHGVDAVALGEAVSALLLTVARQVRLADEAAQGVAF